MKAKREKKCSGCPHFKITCKPIKHYDSGQAVCSKNNLVFEYTSHRQLNNLTCVEEER